MWAVSSVVQYTTELILIKPQLKVSDNVIYKSFNSYIPWLSLSYRVAREILSARDRVIIGFRKNNITIKMRPIMSGRGSSITASKQECHQNNCKIIKLLKNVIIFTVSNPLNGYSKQYNDKLIQEIRLM